MKRNISTRFRHISAPNALLQIVDRETARLQKRYFRISGFSIVVDKPHLKHHKGNQVRAQVVVSLPTGRVVVTKEADGMTERENAVMAIHCAFDAARSAVDAHCHPHHRHGEIHRHWRSVSSLHHRLLGDERHVL
jgi:ribosome-associated translation inhibitor RaiA